jgi:S1-C subfamily serine protease
MNHSGGSTRRNFLAALGSTVAVGTAGCAGSVFGGGAADAETENGAQAAAGGDADDAQAAAGDSPYTAVYRETIGSVVLVRVYGEEGPIGQGSGFVWNRTHVVTNHHVVADADTVRVQFAEGEWETVDVVGSDVYADLAVLSVENRPDYASPLSLVESEPPVGTEVVAFGAPFSLDGSVSAGIISGQNRTLPSGTGFRIADGVQTDAAVNPGNSGGPLVDLDGNVVGVINSGGGDNVAFAISAALTDRIVPSLVENGRYEHPYMGVTLRNVTPLVAEGNDLDRARGVLVGDVLDGAPADGVLQPSGESEVVEGLEVPVGGDVIVGLGDREIPNTSALSTYLALETSPGDTIPVTVLREGERQTVDLTLGERPDPDT